MVEVERSPSRKLNRRGNEFSKEVMTKLAKRSGYQCAICSALTVAASAESHESVTNIGVAAHIAAASPGGARYDALMSAAERSNIQNAIWLCQNHAKEIDDDSTEWPVSKLHRTKRRHELSVRSLIGIPGKMAKRLRTAGLAAQEYAFMRVGKFAPAYRTFIAPILKDRSLGDDHEVGLLMLGSPGNEAPNGERETPWTAFLDPAWLRWMLEGRSAGFNLAEEVPAERIYGRVPGWPDDFMEFLEAIVQTGTTFRWARDRKGYLVLAQA